MEKIINLDQELFLYLNGLGNSSWDGFWMFMTDKWSSIPLYLVLLILCFLRLKWRKTVLILVIVALMVTVSDQVSNLFKYGLERLRPCHDALIEEQMRLVKSYCGGKFGYFSAHASNSFVVVTFFSLIFKGIYKWLPFVLIIWGMVVAYSRIYIGVHYPLDVVTGITIGMLIGVLFYAVYRWVTRRYVLD
ncbi:phosphatase PAP2 family protein [Galbibacter sp.]|uniref:phosphatase PAP2 family protein n=1 Tax=Galbibacter sp. TaxID=2918471 RepID=UPI003A8E7FD4